MAVYPTLRPFVLPVKQAPRAVRMTKGARELSAYRKRKRLSQRALATQIFTTQATVSRIERGLFRPTLEMAMVIERATKIPVAKWTEAAK